MKQIAFSYVDRVTDKAIQVALADDRRVWLPKNAVSAKDDIGAQIRPFDDNSRWLDAEHLAVADWAFTEKGLTETA